MSEAEAKSEEYSTIADNDEMSNTETKDDGNSTIIDNSEILNEETKDCENSTIIDNSEILNEETKDDKYSTIADSGEMSKEETAAKKIKDKENMKILTDKLQESGKKLNISDVVFAMSNISKNINSELISGNQKIKDVFEIFYYTRGPDIIDELKIVLAKLEDVDIETFSNILLNPELYKNDSENNPAALANFIEIMNGIGIEEGGGGEEKKFFVKMIKEIIKSAPKIRTKNQEPNAQKNATCFKLDCGHVVVGCVHKNIYLAN